MIEEGPTKGTTSIFSSWALDTILAPGSAIQGVPESDNKPRSNPSNIGLK